MYVCELWLTKALVCMNSERMGNLGSGSELYRTGEENYDLQSHSGEHMVHVHVSLMLSLSSPVYQVEMICPCLALYLHRKFGPCQLSCLGGLVGKALGLESRVSWVRIPPEVANFSLEKKTSSGELLCLVVWKFD